MRVLILYLVILGVCSAPIFGYKYVTKHSAAITSKLVAAAIIALVITVFIYYGEYQ